MKKYLALVFLIILYSCRKEKVISPAQPRNPYYDKAWFYLEQNDQTKAFINFSKVASFSTDSLLIAKSFTHMAVIQGNQGDYFGSEESAAKAILYFKPNSEYLPGVFNSIGIAKYSLKDFSNASNWYKRAITTATDSLNGLIYQNNLAVSLVEQKKYDEAVSLLYNILQNKRIRKDKAMFAQAYDNLTWAKWLQNPKYNAVPDYHRALNIRLTEQNLWGQNASYAHLADFYMNSNIDSALQYSEKMFATAKAISSPDDQIEALKKLIQLSNADKSKVYFTRFTKLEDSIQTARNAAKNQFALIRYESEKHKADNLKLQQDNTQKKYEIIKRDLIIYVIIVLTIAGIIVSYTIFKKRKQKIELEARKSIQESRLKTSKKVHDVVANGLYRVITEIENQDNIEKEEILDRLDVMYQKSRDISYEVEEIIPATEQLNQTFTELFDSFKTQETNITVKGNTDDLWQSTSPTIRLELEHILQELMVNMSKHSQATQVDISFELEENDLKINYLDNGIGIKNPIKFNNGLTNTGNRIDFINGKITFDTNVERGLYIIITVPIS